MKQSRLKCTDLLHDPKLQHEISIVLDPFISARPLHHLIGEYAQFLGELSQDRTSLWKDVSALPSHIPDVCIPIVDQGMATLVNGESCAFTCYRSPLYVNFCRDPTDGNRWFASTASAIYQWKNGEVKLITGGQAGFNDGVRAEARFQFIRGLVCTKDASALYVADNANHRLRIVDTCTGSVSTAAGNGVWETVDGIGINSGLASPFDLAISNSLLFITSTNESIRIFDTSTSKLTTLETERRFRCFKHAHIAVTPSGILIVAVGGAFAEIYAVNPLNGSANFIGGPMCRLNMPLAPFYGFALSNYHNSIFLCGPPLIQRLTLSPHFFVERPVLS